MTWIAKPSLHHPSLGCNALGLTRRDYEGKSSTLCAGCGHDAISAAIIRACWELSIEPHRVAKLSGIGCSSKTPDYFLGQSHGFNTVHGRMPSVLTGANLANRELVYLGVSGDGDSASIGIGQFVHAIRRGVNMTYIVENNGVYGLTKGQFSATADRGSLSKKGVANADAPIDLAGLALQLGASFVARSFSGDKQQLVPLIKGALSHRGAAFLDVIPEREAISIDYAPGEVLDVPQHDGSVLRLRKLGASHDPSDRAAAIGHLHARQAHGEIVTGLLYVEPDADDLHDHLGTPATPLNALGPEELCPGSAALERINASLR